MVLMISLLAIVSQYVVNTVSTISWSSGPNSLPAPLYGGMVATTANEDVYILGGFCCGGRKTSIYKWSSSSSSVWTTLPTTTPTDLYCPGQCSVLMPNGLFYIIGAYPQHGKTFIFDPSSDNFITSPTIPDMIHPVAYGCVVGDLINNKIYVVGGTDPASSTTYVNYIQIYDIINNIWSVSPSTIPNAMSLATCYLSSNEGLLYIFGGQTYPTTSYWNTVIKYDISTQTVNTLTTVLTVPRYGARVQYIPQQNGVYLIAGYSGNPSKTVEFFDINTDTIITDGIDNLNVLGSYVHVAFVQNRIMVFGGYDTTWLDSAEQTQIFATATSEPTTAEPTTAEPTTSEPTTVELTTSEPTTVEPTTSEPTTGQPITGQPTTNICDVNDENNRCYGRAKHCHKDSKWQNSKYNTFTDLDSDPWCGWCLCVDTDSNNPLEECAYYLLGNNNNWKSYFITEALKGLFMDICFGHLSVDECTFDDVELNEPVSGCSCDTFTCDGEQGTPLNPSGGDINQYKCYIAILISFLVYVIA